MKIEINLYDETGQQVVGKAIERFGEQREALRTIPNLRAWTSRDTELTGHVLPDCPEVECILVICRPTAGQNEALHRRLQDDDVLLMSADDFE